MAIPTYKVLLYTNRVMQREATAHADVDSALRGPASGV